MSQNQSKPTVLRRPAGTIKKSPPPKKPAAKQAGQKKLVKPPVVQTIGIKRAKLSVSEVAEAKAVILKLAHPALRRCYVDMLSRRAVFHKKAQDNVWLQAELVVYFRRQLKHVLHRQTSLAIKGEVLTRVIEKRLAGNYDKQVRKAGFNPEFSQFLFLEQFQALQEIYGKECWYFLKKNLTNIAEASPAWTAQFLSAAKAMGSERLKAANDKYAAITSAPEFQAAGGVRQQYLQSVTARMLEALCC